MLPGEPGDEMVDALRLLASVSRVLQVDVVDDLGERVERGILPPEVAEHHLEGAELAVVSELGLEHVEADLTRCGGVAARSDELEGGRSVDEPADQPGAGDAVDVDALPGDPRALLDVLDPVRASRRLSARRSDRREALLEAGDEAFDGLPPGRAEEVDVADLGEALPEAT